MFSVADNFTEVSNTQNDRVRLVCNYTQYVSLQDKISIVWLNGQTVVQPGLTDNINASIEVSPAPCLHYSH